MTPKQIDAFCGKLPAATRTVQWEGVIVFKVGGKMFCVCCTEPVAPPKVALSFKCDDATFAELVERDGVIPAPYMAQHKWVAPEQFDTLGAAELRELIRHAYEIVSAKLPKKKARKTTAKKPARRTVRLSARKRALRSGRAPARRGR